MLADRLVAIYKGSDPDYLSVVLESDGYDDLETRAEYLEALTEADERIAGRVSALNDEVAAAYEEIADLKAAIDEEARRLEQARSRDRVGPRRSRGSGRRGRRRPGGRAGRPRTSSSSSISGWELEVRREAAEQLGEGAYLGGPYSIPTYIVMCESGGNYRALNPSSGAGGAYQIIPSTWRAYGGEGLPHLASKAEQDRIAAIIWREDGPGAWSCA